MVNQYDIYFINLDPTIGSEIRKTRPCIIISPDEMNKFLNTLVIAPVTSKIHNYPSRVAFILENKNAEIVLDQIRTIDKKRLITKTGKLDKKTIKKIKSVIHEMLVL